MGLVLWERDLILKVFLEAEDQTLGLTTVYGDYLGFMRDPAGGLRSAMLGLRGGTELSVKVAEPGVER